MFVLIVQGVAVPPACAARRASSESHWRVPWCSAYPVMTQKRWWTCRCRRRRDMSTKASFTDS